MNPELLQLKQQIGLAMRCRRKQLCYSRNFMAREMDISISTYVGYEVGKVNRTPNFKKLVWFWQATRCTHLTVLNCDQLLATNLRNARLDANISTRQLCNRLEWNSKGGGGGWVNSYETKRRQPTLGMLLRIANATHTTVPKLYEGMYNENFNFPPTVSPMSPSLCTNTSDPS